MTEQSKEEMDVRGSLSRGLVRLASVMLVAMCLPLLSCDAADDEVTLKFNVVSSGCRLDAHIGAHPYYGGEPIAGLPIEYGDAEVTYVYQGRCPSEGIYITAEEIGGTSFTTDYYFRCRSEPYIVEVYDSGSFCSERVIE